MTKVARDQNLIKQDSLSIISNNIPSVQSVEI